MAGEQILHNAKEIVDEDGYVANGALRDSGVTADTHTSNNTQLVSFTVDAKGRITAASNASVNVTGVTYGNTTSQSHIENQQIFISTGSPGSGDGNDGDIWYQTLT